MVDEQGRAVAPDEVRACPRCGGEVHYPRDPARGPGVAMCPSCGAEVGFGGGAAGEVGGRVVLADPTNPEAAGAPAGAPTVRCSNCGEEVPLRGTSHAERTGATPGDVSDTVTCPSCGVEVDVPPQP